MSDYYLEGGFLVEASNMDGDVFAIPHVSQPFGRRIGKVADRDQSLCKACNDKWINKWTRFCAWHQEHHEMRCGVAAGEISEAEYQEWISGHRATVRGNP